MGQTQTWKMQIGQYIGPNNNDDHRPDNPWIIQQGDPPISRMTRR